MSADIKKREKILGILRALHNRIIEFARATVIALVGSVESRF